MTTIGGCAAFQGTGLVTPTPSTPGSTAPVRVDVDACVAEKGSVLAMDVTGATGQEVQLVGLLVARPSATGTGNVVDLFRGNVSVATPLGTTAPEGAGTPAATTGQVGTIPWGLSGEFVAEAQVQQNAGTGSLTVLFVRPGDPATANPTTTPGGSTASATSSGTTSPASGTTPGAPRAAASTQTVSPSANRVVERLAAVRPARERREGAPQRDRIAA
jgi:hypothetical protein